MVSAEMRRRGGALNAGIHVGFVIIAHVHHVVAPLHGAGEGLEANIIGAAITAEGDELPRLIQLAPLLFMARYAVSTPEMVAAAFSKALWMKLSFHCCFANKLRKIFIQSAKKKRRLKGF